MRYSIAIPPVAAKTPNLKFSVALIRPDLYAISSAPSVPKVRKTAWFTIPGYIASKIREIPPNATPSSAA